MLLAGPVRPGLTTAGTSFGEGVNRTQRWRAPTCSYRRRFARRGSWASLTRAGLATISPRVPRLCVPDLVAAKKYYDEVVAIVGFREWFPADEHQFNYGPDGTLGTQIFFYRALEPNDYSRHGIGLQHLAFRVPTRAVVEQACRWAVGRGSEVVHQPRPFPEYGVQHLRHLLPGPPRHHARSRVPRSRRRHRTRRTPGPLGTDDARKPARGGVDSLSAALRFASRAFDEDGIHVSAVDPRSVSPVVDNNAGEFARAAAWHGRGGVGAGHPVQRSTGWRVSGSLVLTEGSTLQRLLRSFVN